MENIRNQKLEIYWLTAENLFTTYLNVAHLIDGSFKFSLNEDCSRQNFSIELIRKNLIANIK